MSRFGVFAVLVLAGSAVLPQIGHATEAYFPNSTTVMDRAILEAGLLDGIAGARNTVASFPGGALALDGQSTSNVAPGMVHDAPASFPASATVVRG